ncbi:homoprotocatechuate degradation operon regulator HpaR [Herbaspirillum sp. RTI4]|uniref:homoprotocatechuate degradation operon regulator HpaR n=1 Tax=Herbaspirillum sp. RTI4 TaxID=3048640 RepID=UPI002AB4246B|nr:homoprotocatechuate degradation operon regulator HpaR [Herbaspirillum sp. RTI4]MDY7579262.1 homoprotocatechuate degradation operon regulator HpaR [Herbaspirillum sp. RTI4]MEA9982761.1 homoprotocatechuate degradation operon regulator HpaR [Herbaspirillum sp. RTI4]
MEKMSKHRNLALLLLQARECVMGNFRRILNHYGLTEQQWRVIRAISDNDAPMEQWQICETCQILSPSLAGVLVRMEDMQLVERTRVDTDQRRILVTLLSKSHALIKDISPLIEQQYANLEAGIGAETVASLYQALDGFLSKQDNPIDLVDLELSGKKTSIKKLSAGKSAAPVGAPGKKARATRTAATE